MNLINSAKHIHIGLPLAAQRPAAGPIEAGDGEAPAASTGERSPGISLFTISRGPPRVSRPWPRRPPPARGTASFAFSRLTMLDTCMNEEIDK
jgi:hypothetical protein